MEFKCKECGTPNLVVEKQWWVWEGPYGRFLHQRFVLDETHHFEERLDDEVLEHETDWDRADEDHDDETQNS